MRILQIDAFTDQPFRGNPAAVCLLDRERDAAWMQSVGAEMNLSETAFLLPHADGWSLRWFTPTIEVALCGHATLASAHALWEEKLLAPNETARFHTKSGLLTATKRGDLIELDLPATREEKSDVPAGLLDSLGISNPRYVGRDKFDYLVEVDSEEDVRRLKPNHAELRQIPVRGVIVTSRASNGDYDFVSRCRLAPFWSERLGKKEFVASQASPRGGMLRVRLDGDRVKLGGRAVVVLRGDLTV
ncbi:MAG: oxidoreductase [Acidobacteria bacterium]|nr:MAG: oxidoreductase [Acidobacteriota bacterium]